MSQLTPASDINSQDIESIHIHLIDFQTKFLIFILVQNDTLVNTSSQNDVTTTHVDNSTSETPIDISVKYCEPTLIKPINSTFHPRNLKEFSQTGSSPIQCEDSGQRDGLQIRVRIYSKKLKMNT